MKNVYVFPGIMDSDLAILATGDVVWWDPVDSIIPGIGPMRLAPDGVTPQPPDGKQMAVVTDLRWPWSSIQSQLSTQLDPKVWRVQTSHYDWRLDILTQATSLANNIRANSTPAEPATIVGHSMGGLLAVAAWKMLVGTSQQNLVRRIITMDTPFQGSYQTLLFTAGVGPNIEFLLGIGVLNAFTPAFVPAFWTLNFLGDVALTWPSFYELMPSLLGPDAADDPNRPLLYDANNYAVSLRPQQRWLDYAKNTWQPFLFAGDAFPPSWVLTCVYSGGLQTFFRLDNPKIPLNFLNLGITNAGDGVVPASSQLRTPSLPVVVNGYHTSVPYGITTSGLLAQLILDPRGPLTPPPPPLVVPEAIGVNVTDPPPDNVLTGEVCLGGHC